MTNTKALAKNRIPVFLKSLELTLSVAGSDVFIQQMFRDPNSAMFIPERIEELLKQHLTDERESYISTLLTQLESYEKILHSEEFSSLETFGGRVLEMASRQGEIIKRHRQTIRKIKEIFFRPETGLPKIKNELRLRKEDIFYLKEKVMNLVSNMKQGVVHSRSQAQLMLNSLRERMDDDRMRLAKMKTELIQEKNKVIRMEGDMRSKNVEIEKLNERLVQLVQTVNDLHEVEKDNERKTSVMNQVIQENHCLREEITKYQHLLATLHATPSKERENLKKDLVTTMQSSIAELNEKIAHMEQEKVLLVSFSSDRSEKRKHVVENLVKPMLTDSVPMSFSVRQSETTQKRGKDGKKNSNRDSSSNPVESTLTQFQKATETEAQRIVTDFKSESFMLPKKGGYFSDEEEGGLRTARKSFSGEDDPTVIDMVTKLAEEKNRHEQLISGLERTNRSLEDTIDQQKQSLNQAARNEKELKDSISELKADLESARITHEKQQGKISKFEEILNSQNELLQKTVDELEKAKTSQKTLNEKYKTSLQKNDYFTEEISELHEKIRQQQEEQERGRKFVEQKQNEINNLTFTVAQMSDLHNKIIAEVPEKMQSIEDFPSLYFSLKHELESERFLFQKLFQVLEVKTKTDLLPAIENILNNLKQFRTSAKAIGGYASDNEILVDLRKLKQISELFPRKSDIFSEVDDTIQNLKKFQTREASLQKAIAGYSFNTVLTWCNEEIERIKYLEKHLFGILKISSNDQIPDGLSKFNEKNHKIETFFIDLAKLVGANSQETIIHTIQIKQDEAKANVDILTRVQEIVGVSSIPSIPQVLKAFYETAAEKDNILQDITNFVKSPSITLTLSILKRKQDESDQNSLYLSQLVELTQTSHSSSLYHFVEKMLAEMKELEKIISDASNLTGARSRVDFILSLQDKMAKAAAAHETIQSLFYLTDSDSYPNLKTAVTVLISLRDAIRKVSPTYIRGDINELLKYISEGFYTLRTLEESFEVERSDLSKAAKQHIDNANNTTLLLSKILSIINNGEEVRIPRLVDQPYRERTVRSVNEFKDKAQFLEQTVGEINSMGKKFELSASDPLDLIHMIINAEKDELHKELDALFYKDKAEIELKNAADIGKLKDEVMKKEKQADEIRKKLKQVQEDFEIKENDLDRESKDLTSRLRNAENTIENYKRSFHEFLKMIKGKTYDRNIIKAQFPDFFTQSEAQ